jgi:uncharacterized protein (AIM24 family)
MATPKLHPTNIQDGVAPGVKYRIEGELSPVLHLTLDGSTEVFFEHHVILWKQPEINVKLLKLRGAFSRVIAGMPIFMTIAEGAGEIAFSRDNPGHVFPINLKPGESILVREHQILAATTTGEYTFERVKGISSMVFGNQGFFIDRFTAGDQGMTIWLFAHGNAFDLELAAGEVIDLEPGSWVYYEDGVSYSQQVFGLKTGLLGGGGNLVFNRFVGPGRIGIQSGYITLEGLNGSGGAVGKVATAGAIGGLLGGLLNN